MTLLHWHDISLWDFMTIPNNRKPHFGIHKWKHKQFSWLYYKARTSCCSPFILTRQIMFPEHLVVSHNAHVIMGTGGWLVRKVGRKQGRSVIFNHHYVILWHVHSWRKLMVTWERDGNRHAVLDSTAYMLYYNTNLCIHSPPNLLEWHGQFIFV